MSERHLEHDWFPEPLPDNVEIGPGSWLHSSFAFLHYRSRQRPGVVIGASSGVYKGSFFDLGPRGRVRIGDYCSLVGAILATNGTIEIGDYALIAHEVVFADHPAYTPPRDHDPRRDGPVTVLEQDVWIGARAVILGGSRIGRGSVVGAAAVVAGDFPERSVVAGNPARVVGRIGVSPSRTPR